MSALLTTQNFVNGHDHNPVSSRAVDVLIVGGGATGLIISYILLKAGLNVFTIEQHDTTQHAMYGRACMLLARSLEILDQLGLYEPIAEVGYILRGAVTYKGREELNTRSWTFINKTLDGKTHFDFSFGIRQNVSEQAFRNAVYNLDPKAIHAPAKLLDFSVDESQEYSVLSKVKIDGVITEIHSKYLVGADGGQSTVRSLANIPFQGTASPLRWIRLDAIVRTDMPSGRRGTVSIESASHGNILWMPTDNGRTRIGFVCPTELYGENGDGIDANAIMAEAQKALKPFFVEFVKLDWWTVYDVGQHIAESFREGPILLTGEAGHTHSSGAAQDMNTGIHDASNLSWKLAGVLKGWFTESILDTYATERRASAQQLIQLDKDVSSLISGVIPAHFDAPPGADANEYLDKVFTTSAMFTVGLGIHYEENLINRCNACLDDIAKSLRVQTGHRAPDPPLFRPGSRYPKRLQELTPYRGKFWILAFVGGLDPESDQPRLRQNNIDQLAVLRSYVEGPFSFANTPVFEFLTVVRGDGILQTAETLDGQPLGKAVYDQSGEAYEMYGVDETAGAIIILRPDGIVGCIAAIGQYEALGDYFAQFVRPIVGGQVQKQGLNEAMQLTLVENSKSGGGYGAQEV